MTPYVVVTFINPIATEETRLPTLIASSPENVGGRLLR